MSDDLIREVESTYLRNELTEEGRDLLSRVSTALRQHAARMRELEHREVDAQSVLIRTRVALGLHRDSHDPLVEYAAQVRERAERAEADRAALLALLQEVFDWEKLNIDPDRANRIWVAIAASGVPRTSRSDAERIAKERINDLGPGSR